MVKYFQDMLKIFIMLVHIVGVSLVVLIILFSEDIWIIIAIVICQTFVFIQIILMNGCLMSKYEDMIGDSSFNLSDICKNAFYLSKDMPQADFEKMIVAMPLLIGIIKLGFMLLPEDISSGIQKKYFSLAGLMAQNSEIKKVYTSLKMPKL